MKNSAKKIILIILVICLTCIAGFKIYDTVKNKTPQINTADDSILKAEKEAVSKNNSDAPCPVSVDFDKLSEINRDVVAWIYSKDIKISCPVVQGIDNSEYRFKTFDSLMNNSGAIYLDYENSYDFSDYKSIIYDNNPDINSIFSTILNYSSQEYYDAHKSLWLITPDKSYKLEIISAYKTSSFSDDFSLAHSKSDFESYIKNAADKSLFKSDTDISSVENIVVLSACSNGNNDPEERFVLVTGIKPTV